MVVRTCPGFPNQIRSNSNSSYLIPDYAEIKDYQAHDGAESEVRRLGMFASALEFIFI